MTDHRDPTGVPLSASLRRVRWPEDLALVRGLFVDYRAWIADHRDPDPSARARVEEGLAILDGLIADLPRAYGPPRGDILLWLDQGSVVACGALREMEPGIAEIKRISVRADYRGKEFGRPFVRALLARARELQYERIRADTLPSMQAAIEFYQEAGFRRVEPFWPHPVAAAVFFERSLDRSADPEPTGDD